MTLKKQFTINIDLSEKLANYIASNPEDVKNLPEDASFVTFSSHDVSLNNANMKLVEGLLEEGRSVVKATETNDKKSPWKFTQISA